MHDYRVLASLRRLIQTDIDAIRAYGQAIAATRDEDVAAMLEGFRDDHERHVSELGDAIRALGGHAPVAPDLSGLAIEGFTAFTSRSFPSGALVAMESNEIVTNEAYRRATDLALPQELADLVRRNYEDEQSHLQAIRQRLETGATAGPLLSQTARMQGWATSLWMNNLRDLLP